MKTIDTLIKLHQKELDAKRLELVDLQTQKEKLLDYSAEMERDLVKEQEFAIKNPEMSITFESYRSEIKDRQENIRITVSHIDKQVSDLLEQIAEVFGEVKRYEIIKQQTEEEESQLLKQAESKMLDEMAINGHLQKVEE